MKKADSLWSFAAAAALALSACSSDSGANDAGGFVAMVPVADTGTVQSMSPVAVPTTPDAGTPTPAGMDAGTTIIEAGPIADAGTLPADTGVTDGGDASLEAGSGDPEFDTCYAQLKALCVAKEMNTAALMETPCKALQNIPLPLTDGGAYGPTTVQGGPYGGRAHWNQGKGTPFANEVNILEDVCIPIGIDTFNEPKSVTDELKNLRDLDWALYTIFRPACFKKGEKYPVITWANGTCGEMAGYAALLTAVASHGFVVVASNSTWTATAPTDMVQLRALDYAKALNEDPMSPLYQKLDMDHIGAMGHSQGAGATGTADNDPRIKASIYWNSGTSNEKPFLNVSGDRDIGGTNTPATMTTAVNAATKPGAWVYFHQVPQTGGDSTGHLTLMEQPERVVDMAVAWWKWQLKDDATAKKMFVGDDCGLCNKKEEFEYGKNTLLQ
jgi:hypothetical protein